MTTPDPQHPTEARAEAREKRNTIRTLQSILAVPLSSAEELSGK